MNLLLLYMYALYFILSICTLVSDYLWLQLAAFKMLNIVFHGNDKIVDREPLSGQILRVCGIYSTVGLYSLSVHCACACGMKL